MSLLDDVAARVRAASAGLPTDQVAVAIHRLRAAADLLLWVRQASVDTLGAPRLASATEHAERAAHALRTAQDELARYLTEIGMPASVPAPTDTGGQGTGTADDGRTPARADGSDPSGAVPWWRARVAALTGVPAPTDDAADAATDPAELLRRVAAAVVAADRDRLGRTLHAAPPAVGLTLSAVTTPVLRRLAGDLLGREPAPPDLPRLRDAAGGRVRELLPGTAPALIDTMLARVCRAPTGPGDGPVPAADSAVTASVLAGVLVARQGGDTARLQAAAPDRADRRDGDA